MWEWESLDAMHLHALLWTLFIGLLIRSSGTAQMVGKSRPWVFIMVFISRRRVTIAYRLLRDHIPHMGWRKAARDPAVSGNGLAALALADTFFRHQLITSPTNSHPGLIEFRQVSPSGR